MSESQPAEGYSETVLDHFERPRNNGELEDANAVGYMTNPVCGDTLLLMLRVARAYDVVAEDDPRRSRRALFVIEQDGVIAYAANPFSPNNLSQLEGAFRALGLEL